MRYSSAKSSQASLELSISAALNRGRCRRLSLAHLSEITCFPPRYFHLAWLLKNNSLARSSSHRCLYDRECHLPYIQKRIQRDLGCLDSKLWRHCDLFPARHQL